MIPLRKAREFALEILEGPARVHSHIHKIKTGDINVEIFWEFMQTPVFMFVLIGASTFLEVDGCCPDIGPCSR